MSKIEQPPPPRDEWPTETELHPIQRAVYDMRNVEIRIAGVKLNPCRFCYILIGEAHVCPFCGAFQT